MKNRIRLFLTGLLQVSLVAINTWQIAHSKWLGCFIVGFGISLVWTFNVKSVAFGDNLDRLVYSIGAAVGGVIGMGLAVLFYR